MRFILALLKLTEVTFSKIIDNMTQRILEYTGNHFRSTISLLSKRLTLKRHTFSSRLKHLAKLYVFVLFVAIQFIHGYSVYH